MSRTKARTRPTNPESGIEAISIVLKSRGPEQRNQRRIIESVIDTVPAYRAKTDFILDVAELALTSEMGEASSDTRLFDELILRARALKTKGGLCRQG